MKKQKYTYYFVHKYLPERWRLQSEWEKSKLVGEFDANKDYFTHTEWVKAGTGFGFLLGVFVSVCIWFLIKI